MDRKKRYQLISVLIHMVILLLLSLPLFREVIEDWGQHVIVIELEQEVTQNGNPKSVLKNSDYKTSLPEVKNSVEVDPGKSVEIKNTPVEPEDNKPAVNEPSSIGEENLVTSPEKEAWNTDIGQSEKHDSATKAKADEEETRRKAEYEKLKGSYGTLLKSEVADDSNSGNNGDESPRRSSHDADLRESMATVGGDLQGRRVIHYPWIEDDSQRKGIVVIKICVDSRGMVRYARYTQKGSTTTDLYLVDLALNASRRYVFSASASEKQCGTIAFDFQLK